MKNIIAYYDPAVEMWRSCKVIHITESGANVVEVFDIYGVYCGVRTVTKDDKVKYDSIQNSTIL